MKKEVNLPMKTIGLQKWQLWCWLYRQRQQWPVYGTEDTVKDGCVFIDGDSWDAEDNDHVNDAANCSNQNWEIQSLLNGAKFE